MSEHSTLHRLLDLIEAGKLTEIQAERLLNAETRLESGVPTGQPVSDIQNEDHPQGR